MNLQIDPPLDLFLIRSVIAACEQAGHAIMDVYQSPAARQVHYKADASPITVADERAHRILTSSLAQLSPDLPVLSEESDEVPFALRSAWSRYWLVDPLDGTREFVERTDEFTVNVALIDKGKPVFGVVHAPLLKVSYWGGPAFGAFKQENGLEQAIRVREEGARQQGCIIVQSRRHGKQASALFDELFGLYHGAKTVELGSSLKYGWIAEGRADACLREAPTCEWDTAASQAVLEGAGGRFVFQGHASQSDSCVYNQSASLKNPHFLAIGECSGLLQLWIEKSLMQHWN